MDEKKKKAFDFTKLKKENFVVIFLVGILLLVVAWPIEDKKSGNQGTVSDLSDTGSSIIGASNEEAAAGITKTLMGSDDAENYARSLEKSLEELLSSMEGAGRVKVMITLKSSGESVVEKDTESDRVSSTEVDSSGGSRNSADVSLGEETVYTDGSKGTGTPFVKQIIYPQIEGVVVSAEGGGSASVNKNISEAIQALFGIDVHKIKVIKMSSR